MGFHTYDPERADNLEDVSRYRYLSREELLGLIKPRSEQTLADLGSGTGFYTDDVSPYVDFLYAVDVQEEMHDYYREKGVPGNVKLVTAGISQLPFDDGELDGAFSTMTYHEFASQESLAEVHRVLQEGGRFAVVDWTSNGEGESGPPLDERYNLERAKEHLKEQEFEVVHADERVETFVIAVTATR